MISQKFIRKILYLEKQTFMLLIFSFLASGASAQELQPSSHPLCDWEIKGRIEPGFSKEIDNTEMTALVRNIASETIICLDGPGGSLDEAIELFHWIRENQIITLIPRGWKCYSACAIAFLGGSLRVGTGSVFVRSRILMPGGEIGFHAPYLSIDTSEYYTADQVKQAWNSYAKIVDRLIRMNQINVQGKNLLSDFLMRRIIAHHSDALLKIETVSEAFFAEISIAGAERIDELTLAAAENACDLSVSRYLNTLQYYGYRNIDLIQMLHDIRSFRREEARKTHEYRPAQLVQRIGSNTQRAVLHSYPGLTPRTRIACEVNYRRPQGRSDSGYIEVGNSVTLGRDEKSGFGEARLYSYIWNKISFDNLEEIEIEETYQLQGYEFHPPDARLNEIADKGIQAYIYDRIEFNGADIFGSDLKNTSLEDCIEICRRTSGCVAFSYVKDLNWCRPKSGLNEVVRNSDVLSGVMVGARGPKPIPF